MISFKKNLFAGALTTFGAFIAPLQAGWVYPEAEKTEHLFCFAPGILSSEILLGRYCPSFIASTGERVTCSQGIETLPPQAFGCTFPEIELYQVKNCTGLRYKLHYKLFLAEHMPNGFSIQRATSPEAPTLACHSVSFTKINCGQKNDLKALDCCIKKERSKIAPVKKQKLILYGASRGAAAIFDYAALYAPADIGALVCEGIFDTVSHTAQAGSWSTGIKVGLLKNFGVTDFKKEGIAPIFVYNNLPKDMPIALITSHADVIVPFTCTYKLYQKLKKAGFMHVHLLVLENPTHNRYAFCQEKDTYQSFIHAFYKKYNLPHIPAYAAAGKELLV